MRITYLNIIHCICLLIYSSASFRCCINRYEHYVYVIQAAKRTHDANPIHFIHKYQNDCLPRKNYDL